MNEFIEWIHLVDEIADHQLKEIAVTKETWTMLVMEWQRTSNYAWSKFRIYKDFNEVNDNLTLDISNKRPLKIILETREL